jgi:hypothetical protein
MAAKEDTTSILLHSIAALMAALFIFAAFVIGRRLPHKTPETPLKPKADTLYLHDTIRIATPVPTHTEPNINIEILWTPDPDDDADDDADDAADTIAVPVPIERKTYEDSSYRAVVSGWHPSLDTLDIFQKTTIIEKEIPVPVKTAPRWSLGVTAGYGAGKDGLTPFVGVGVTYNLLSF